MTEEHETIRATIVYKIPFLILGLAIGMGTVWIAFKLFTPMLAAIAN